MKPSYLLSFSFFFFWAVLTSVSGRSQTSAEVYAGIELSISPLMGGGMDRRDITLYLRPDGTFTSKMKEKDWKTNVEGTYRKTTSLLILNYQKKEKPVNYKIDDKGRLVTGGGYKLFKMDNTGTIPAGNYAFSAASGSGGGASGVPFVGTSTDKRFYFDGKAGFIQGGQDAVVISGENVGGGNSKKNKATGTYVLSGSELTLTYTNGGISKHSFFISDKDPLMAVIDGRIFFMKGTGNNKPKTNGEAPTPEKDKVKTGDLPAASFLVGKTWEAHGGKAIDDIKTIMAKGTLQGLTITSVADLLREWLRLELWQGSTLIMVEQWENGSGWHWMKGKKTALPAERAKEMNYFFYTGMAVLQSNRSSVLNAAKVSKINDNYSLSYQADGNEFVFIIDRNYIILGQANQLNNQLNGIKYADYKKVNGVKLPFTEKYTTGKNERVLKLSAIEINVLPSDAWKIPG